MGRNGVGKTTTLKTIVGLLAPLGGSIDLRPRALPASSPRPAPAGIGYVPQGRDIFPNLTVDGESAHRPGRQRRKAQRQS